MASTSSNSGKKGNQNTEQELSPSKNQNPPSRKPHAINKSDNALLRFFNENYRTIRSQPEVDTLVEWVKANPKKSAGIGVGLLLLARTKGAKDLAKLALSTGAIGWLYNQMLIQNQNPPQRIHTSSYTPERHLH